LLDAVDAGRVGLDPHRPSLSVHHERLSGLNPQRFTPGLFGLSAVLTPGRILAGNAMNENM
jgi:hypothetical protein